MIGMPHGARIWLACGATDMRRGFDGLAALVQTQLAADPYAGHLFVFRGRRGNRLKILWYSGDGMNLLSKRLDGGKFVWPQTAMGTVGLTNAELSMLLEGIDWVRRETGERQRVKVPHNEGVANRIDPESCGGVSDGAVEALTGAYVGQPLSDEILHIRSADAIQSAEGEMTAATARAAASSAASEDPGMRIRLSFGNREISGPPAKASLSGWVAGGTCCHRPSTPRISD
jgi:transposase